MPNWLVDLGEVLVEDPLFGDSGPLKEPGGLALVERGTWRSMSSPEWSSAGRAR